MASVVFTLALLAVVAIACVPQIFTNPATVPFRIAYHLWSRWGIYAAVVILGFPPLIAISVMLTPEQSDWHYLIQFMLGGWPDGFPLGRVDLLTGGVFLQAAVGVGVPVLIVSSLRALLRRKDLMQLPEFLQRRDRYIRSDLTEVAFNLVLENLARAGASVPERTEDREAIYGPLAAAIREAFAKSVVQFDQDLAGETKEDLSKAWIHVPGDHYLVPADDK